MKAVGQTTSSASSKSNSPFFKKIGNENSIGKSADKQPFFQSSSRAKPFFQTKLTIGQPGDHYEKEADAVADQVVQRLAAPDATAQKNPTIQPKPLTHGITPLLQSKCDSCEQEEKLRKKDDELDQEQPELQKKPIFESKGDPPEDKFPHFQRKPIFESNADPTEEQLQRKEAGPPAAASSSVETGISNTKSSGRPLAPETNDSMSKAFGTDFSGVRIHDDSSAAQLSKDLNAQAFTHGNDIYFNSGKYATNSTAGQHLLAHELTHTVQQGNTIRKKEEKKDKKDKKEKLPPLKKASDAELLEQKKTKGDYQGYFTKKGKDYEVHLDKLVAKRYLKEKDVKIDTPYRLPKPSEERETSQMSIWKSEVKEDVLKLLAKICTVEEKDTDNLLKLALKKSKAKGLIGTFKQVVNEVIVPFWGKNGKSMLYDVEHMIDWQLVGKKADKIENLILLDRSYNRTLGNEVKASIDTHVKKLAEHYSKEFTVDTSPDNVRANFQIVVESLDFQEERIKKEQLYSKDELLDAVAGAYQKKHIEVGPATIPRGHFLLKTTMGRAGYILPNNAKKERIGTWYVTTKYNKKTEEIESIKLELAIEDKDKIIEVGKGDIDAIDYKKFDANVYQIEGTDLRKQFGTAFKELQVKPFSPIVLDEPDIDGFNAKVSGKVVSNISFLKDVDIRFQFENGEFLIQAEIPLSNVGKNIPKPFEVTSCSILISAGSREGLTLAGNLSFRLGKFGEGELTAGINNRIGFFLRGSFDFDSKYFNPANISFDYEKGKWNIKGTIGIEEGTIRGVKRATLEVGYKDGKFTAEGNAELTVPGVEKIILAAEFDVQGNFAFSAEVALGKLPGIKSGNVKVWVKSKEGEEGVKVSAAGKATPDFPAIPDLSAEFSVLYDDGVFDVNGIATYKKGRFTGTVQIGVTNKAVDDKGKPQGEAPPEKGPVVVYGFGQLTVDLWKENKGTVSVRLTPEKDVLVAGIILLKNLKPFGDGYHFNKPLVTFPTIKIPLVGLPGLSISAFINGGVYFKFDWDPLVLKELKVELKEINVNEIENANLDIHGSVGSIADAEVYMVIRAGLEAQALIARLRGSIGGEAGVGIRAEAGGELDATFNKDKGLQFKEIRAFMNVTPRAVFRLTGEVSVDLDLWFTEINLYYHKWVFAEKALDLSGLTLKIDFPIKFAEDNSLILPDVEQMNLQKPEFSGAQGQQILDDAINGDAKKEVEEKKRQIREDVKIDLRKGRYDEDFTLSKYKKKMEDKYEDNAALREYVLKTIDEEARVLEYELFEKHKNEIRAANIPLSTKLSILNIYTMWSLHISASDIEAFRMELIKAEEDKKLAQQASQLPDDLTDKLPGEGSPTASGSTPPPNSSSSPSTSNSTLQKKEDTAQAGGADHSAIGASSANTIESFLDSSGDKGVPLPEGTKQEMESSLGADLSNVRIHDDDQSAQMNKSLKSQAFAHGSDIYFNHGKYDPENENGKHLLAHELTHVMQQNSGGADPENPVQRQPEHANPVITEVQDLTGITNIGSVQDFDAAKWLKQLNIPPETIPPGVVQNQDFKLALLKRLNPTSASVMVPLDNVPGDFAGLQNNQMVEVHGESVLDIFLKNQGDDDKNIPNYAGRAATKGVNTALGAAGFSAAGPNAIGIVAFPMSKTARVTVGGGKWGTPGPYLPGSQIVLGHTALYARIDGKIAIIKSYGPASLVDAAKNIKGVSAGTKGVDAKILDHMSGKGPGGNMFEVNQARSIEYPLSKENVEKFVKDLPPAGPVPGGSYTARPETAGLCKGRNCVHWAVEWVEKTLGTQIGEGGTSQKDIGGTNTARQGKVMELLSEKNPKPLKLPDGSTIQPKTGSIPTSMKIIKYGGKIFTLVDIGSSIHRIWNASDEELIQVIGEEAGGFAFGAIGAQAGAGICVAIGVPTGGLGLIACGIVGAIGGSKVGKYVGGAVFGLPMAILQGMHVVAWLLEGFMDVTEAGGRAIHGFFQFIFEEQVKAHERLNYENWDVRFLPGPLKNDINLLGQNMWSLLNREEVGAPKRTQPMDKVYSVLKKSQFKLIELGIPLPLLQSIAQKMTEINVKNGGTPYSADQFVNMNSVEFVEFLEMWRLQFKQNPIFIANPENYWSAGDPHTHMDHLNIHYRNVIETRSKLNIHNWGSFAVKEPLFEFFEREQAKEEAKKANNTEPEPTPTDEGMLPDETPVDMVAAGYDFYDALGQSLEDHIREIGRLVWSVMGPLNFKDFTSLMYKPLSAFNPDQTKVKQIAHGLTLVVNAIGNKQGNGILQMTDIDADYILTQTPADLVNSLAQYNLLTFNKAPSEIAEVALIWMNVGFEPW